MHFTRQTRFVVENSFTLIQEGDTLAFEGIALVLRPTDQEALIAIIDEVRGGARGTSLPLVNNEPHTYSRLTRKQGESANSFARRQRAHAKAYGFCTHCYARPAGGGVATCPKCRTVVNRWSLASYHKKKCLPQKV